MTEKEQELCAGISFYVEAMRPKSVVEEEDGDEDEAKYFAYALMTPKADRLIIKIWDHEDDDSRVEIDGESTFVFDVLPHRRDEDEDEDDDDDDEKGYDYRPRGRYGVCDNDMYDGCMMYPTVKCLIVDLIESSIE